MSLSRTIRLQNRREGNLSLHLHQLIATARGSLRRGPMLTPISIPAGAYYDVCQELKVSFDDAKRIVKQSPEVSAFERKNYLNVIDFPPPVVEPPPPPVVVQAVVAEPVVEPVADEQEVAPPQSEPEMLAEEPPPPLEELPAETALERPHGVVQPRAVREPSMDWSEPELREYAAKRGIDVSNAKSKTAVLRLIRGMR